MYQGEKVASSQKATSHATYSVRNVSKSDSLVNESFGMDATYSARSVSESDLLVHDSHRLQAQSNHHATYSGGSICESGVSFHDNHGLQPQSYHHPGGSICESGLSGIVSVKVACPSTDCSHRATTMLLILVEVSVNVACWLFW